MKRGLLFLMLAACWDSAHTDAVAALGDEAPGEEPGPTHRAGQPCTTCHGGSGPGSPEFSVAGTVYAERGGSTAAPGALVIITDARGVVRTFQANTVGNFYVSKEEWAPIFPLRATVSSGGQKQDMITTIGRDGGCGSCHRDGGDSRKMPAVYVREP